MRKSAASVRRDSRDHPEIHVVAGCVVTTTESEGRELVERVSTGHVPTFWGHYRVAEDGRQQWLADYDDRESALVAAKLHAGTKPIYVEDNGILTLISR